MSAPWLAVIDPQNIFALPQSPWAAPGFAAVLEPIQQLIAAAGPRLTVTRFIAPPEPRGAWIDYYRQWPFARLPPTDPMYQVVDDLEWAGRPTLDANTFSKWGAELAGAVGDSDLILAGVSTDCCVLSTAVAAADAGVRVLVVADACAGADQNSHRQALELLALYGPIISIVTTTEALARWSR